MTARGALYTPLPSKTGENYFSKNYLKPLEMNIRKCSKSEIFLQENLLNLRKN